MRGKFAGLGFDPAPGNAGDVRAAADAMAGAGDQLAGSPGSMRSTLTTGGWQGAAAEGFAAAGAPVPGALESAHGQLRSASQALRTWHGQLVVNQHAAERLDKTAKQLRTELAEAERDVLAADTRLASATGPNRTQAEAALRAAHQHLANLRTRLATTLRAGHRLAQRHKREADSAAAALRGTPPSTSWPDGAVTGVATGAGGTSAWTGQVATITLPGQTDPVVALPIGAQPGDPDWPLLPTDPATGLPVNPAGLPDDLTGASSAPVDPLAPIPPVDGLPLDPTGTNPDGTTRPATAVLASPVPEPVTAISDHDRVTDRGLGHTAAAAAEVPTAHRPVATQHQQPPVARVVTTPSHVVRSPAHETSSSTPVHRSTATTPHSTGARTYDSVRAGTPAHHLPAEPAPARQPARSGGTPAPAEPHPLRPIPAAVPAAPVAPSTPAPVDATSAETATVAPSRSDTEAKPATADPTPNSTQGNPPNNPGHDSRPAQHLAHQPAPQSSTVAPGQQVGAADQGRTPGQPGGQGNQQGGNAEHRKGADPLPATPLAADPLPGNYTGVVLPAPPQWDGTSVTPLHEAGLLPGVEDGLWATFVIAAALGPVLIAESLANGRERDRTKKRQSKPNRMRAFVLQPGGEQLVMLTLQARSAEGWTTQRALFLRAVAQYRRPAEPVLSS